jgi:hypothetical protein
MIRTGTLLIQKGTPVPDFLQIGTGTPLWDCLT